MANKQIKRCLPSLIIRHMQIKTTLRYHLTPVRMAIIKKARNNKCWQAYGQKGTLRHCSSECEMVQPLLEGSMEIPQKLRIALPYDPAIPLLGVYPKI